MFLLNSPVQVCIFPCVHNQKSITVAVATFLPGENVTATAIALGVTGSSRTVPTVLLAEFQREGQACLDEARGSERRL